MPRAAERVALRRCRWRRRRRRTWRRRRGWRACGRGPWQKASSPSGRAKGIASGGSLYESYERSRACALPLGARLERRGASASSNRAAARRREQLHGARRRPGAAGPGRRASPATSAPSGCAVDSSATRRADGDRAARGGWRGSYGEADCGRLPVERLKAQPTARAASPAGPRRADASGGAGRSRSDRTRARAGARCRVAAAVAAGRDRAERRRSGLATRLRSAR